MMDGLLAHVGRCRAHHTELALKIFIIDRCNYHDGLLPEQLRSYQRGRLRLGKRVCSGQPVPALSSKAFACFRSCVSKSSVNQA